MNRLKNMNACLEAIMKLNIDDTFKGFIKRLHTFLKNKKVLDLNDIRLPNVLIATIPGGGVSTIVKILTEYLHVAKAIDFCGTVKSFEFKLDYIPPDTRFSELTRLDNAIVDYAGYNRYFKGVACIDIDAWREHTTEEHFLRFLEYIVCNSDNLLVVFCIRTDLGRSFKTVEAALSSHMRIESLYLQFPAAEELVDIMESQLFRDNGFSFADDAKFLLCDTVEKLSTSQSFNGFKTISQLAGDILHTVLTQNVDYSRPLTAQMLCNYSKDSAYVKRVVSSKVTNVIGFMEREAYR